MSKKRRRSGSGRKAYLKKAHYSYDPYSPYALRTRGAKAINLGALIREPGEGPASKRKLVPIEYHTTQTHGKRGLTLSRAIGPTVKAAHVGGAATTIPLAELAQRRLDVAAGKTVWASQRYSGVDEWAHIVLMDARPYKLEELWFEGQRWKLVVTDYEAGVERRTIVYQSRELLMTLRKHKRLTWEDTIPIQSVPPTA